MTIDQRLKRARKHKRAWPKGSAQRAYWKTVVRALRAQAETLAT